MGKRNHNFDIWWQKLLIEKQIENDGKYFICLRFPTISHTCDQRFTTCRRIYLHQLTCCCRCCSLNIQPQNVINIIYSLIKHEQASVSRCIYIWKMHKPNFVDLRSQYIISMYKLLKIPNICDVTRNLIPKKTYQNSLYSIFHACVYWWIFRLHKIYLWKYQGQKHLVIMMMNTFYFFHKERST